MRQILLILIFNILCLNIYAQISNDLIIEHIEKMSEVMEEESTDYSELLESYWNIIENPIDINSDDINMLAELRLISMFQLESIKAYRRNYGDIQFMEELYEVENMDSISVEIIKDVICFESKKDKLKIRDLKYGKSKILMEVSQCLNKKKGYFDIEDSLLYQKPNSVYLGSPQKIYLRYNYTYKNKIEAGFVMEKDPGEYIFKNKLNDSIRRLLDGRCYSGFDMFSFHLCFINFWFLKTLAIGDYKLSFGQGLTMGSGMAFVAKGGNLLRRNRKIAASKSANETHYLRGIAGTLNLKNFELSFFYSNKNSDANIISYDTLNETPLKVSSLQQSGLHRTYNEMLDRRVISQQLYGLNLSYQKSSFQLGYTIHKTDLSADLHPERNIYNSFYFRGRNIINQGIDFYYIANRIFIYGEAAMSDNKAFA